MKFDSVFVVFEGRLALGKDWREIGFGFGVIFELLDEDVPIGSERLESGGIGSSDGVNNHGNKNKRGSKRHY
jgi:hypothetical protein